MTEERRPEQAAEVEDLEVSLEDSAHVMGGDERAS
jgi:hypothetical protein